MLPEACVATILSCTSPYDACRSSLLSSSFRSLADSDWVWHRFLPSDYEDMVKRAVTPLKFSSKKELFFSLCTPILIDGGNKCFQLEKYCGMKSYILSARELSITWSDDPFHWSWRQMPQTSFFSEVAELKTTSRLEIEGKINTGVLTKNTLYGAYLIMNLSDRSFGLDCAASETRVEVSGRDLHCGGRGTAYLCFKDSKKQLMENLLYANRTEMLRRSMVMEENSHVPQRREDGWLELQLGIFLTCDMNEEVKISLKELNGYQLKGGLILEGMEVRPIQQIPKLD